MVAQMMSLDKKEDLKFKIQYLKDSVEPRYLVESLGFQITRETPRELRGPCIIHGGDNVTAFRFNKERKTWVCFSHKCHDVFGNDIIGLIKAVNKIEFPDALNWLQDLVGLYDSDIDAIDYKRRREREEFINYTKRGDLDVPKVVSEQHLKSFRPYRSKFFNAEGYTNELLDYFEIGGGYVDSYGYIRDVIPIRDAHKNLVAYSLRDTRENVSYDYKYILTPGFDKDKVLYNLHNIIPTDKPIIVVEGFKSVWRMYSYGIKNVVAVMGSEITQGQRNLLLSHALNGVVVMFDNDMAGRVGTMNAFKELGNKLDFYPVFMTEEDEHGKGLDPSDIKKEQLYGYLESYI